MKFNIYVDGKDFIVTTHSYPGLKKIGETIDTAEIDKIINNYKVENNV